ncbi:hypothetical protein [Nocardioides sp.]|uniref:hypothetical protein n=1 Tax=Nocardioides sp. TaxID=35761 RepID=UPI00352870C2
MSPRTASRSAGRRAARREDRPSRLRTLATAAAPRLLVLLHLLLVLTGIAGLVASAAGVGPAYAGGAGAALITTTYTWVLALRTSGRWMLFTLLVGALSGLAAFGDYDLLRTGAAVSTASLGAVLGVMVTVPTVRFAAAAREVLLAMGVAFVGAVAAVGYEPVINVARFGYTTLVVSFVLVFALVYRLGAGLHGLGRRGLIVVVGGGVVLGVTLAYAELLRRYGTPGLVTSVFDTIDWTRDHLGAFPRPLQALLGIPALAWGCHQRARRRQGWWVSAFGVGATVPISHLVVSPAFTLPHLALAELYTLVVGLLLGYVVIRIDLRMTGSRGRRGRRAEEAAAIRPEPPRTQALL